MRLLLLVFLLFQAGPDSAIRSTMLQSEPALPDVQVMRRTNVGEGLDLVIASGRSRTSIRDTVGLFLQDQRNTRGSPALVYKLDIEASDNGCFAHVEAATATDAVISCTPEGYERGQYWKVIYDLHAKALVRQFHYLPFSAWRVFPNREGAVFIASDTEKLIVVEYRPGASQFRILSDVEARPWIEKVHVSTGTVGIEQRQVISIDPEEKSLPAVFPPLPQSTYDEFAAARPERVKNGYVRQGTEIHESPGPWQREGEKIWFGKTFYDGEGSTGVGGFGYFDLSTRSLKTYSPSEIADWSVTSMLVRPEAVWMGIAWLGEGASPSGGLLRFDRATGQIRRLKFPDFAIRMESAGNTILIASDFGIGIVNAGVIRRYFIDRVSDGRYRVVEAK